MKLRFDPQALWSKYFSSVNSVIRAGLGIGIVALFAATYIRSDELTFFQRLELLAYDARLRATMPERIDSRVVIVDIDEKSLSAEGRWPWGRDKFAIMLDQLFDKYKAKVAGFDVIFAEPDTSSGLKSLDDLAQGPLKGSSDFQSQVAAMRPKLDYDARFTEQIKKNSVVLSFAGSNERTELSKLEIGSLPNASFRVEDAKGRPIKALEIPGYSAPLKRFQDVAAATGHILPQIDFDGVLRRVPAFIRHKDGYYEALSIALYRTFLDNEPLVMKLRPDEGDNITKIDTVTLRNAKVHVDDDTSMLVPYRGRSPMFRYVSATDVIRGALQPGELEGKIVIVGTSAQGLFDLRNTPVGEVYPGVEIHANLVSGLLDNNIKRKPHFEQSIKVLTILLVGLPLAFALVKLSPVWSTATVLLTGIALIAFNLYWWSANVVLPIAMPILMIGTLYLLNMAYGFFVEDRSKRQITGIFGTYVPKELVEEMAKNPSDYSMRGESREMTVLFSDVRNFTSISEGLSATGLTAMMNSYLTEMTHSIQITRGTIDKYIGDAIMAFWGAPLSDEKHAENALDAAMAMQKRIGEIGPDFVKRGWPKLEIGVGLNCGVMNVGDMGSSFRRAYTVMGDAVNLASRLEGLTKEYGVGILVSENIVKTVTSYVYRELDRVRVKGKLEPIGIYEPVGRVGTLSNADLDELDRFQRALEHYRAQRWDDAENALVNLARANPTKKTYQIFLERVNDLRMKPPGSNWDGVFTFQTK
jgi:adenylate cyclase